MSVDGFVDGPQIRGKRFVVREILGLARRELRVRARFQLLHVFLPVRERRFRSGRSEGLFECDQLPRIRFDKLAMSLQHILDTVMPSYLLPECKPHKARDRQQKSSER